MATKFGVIKKSRFSKIVQWQHPDGSVWQTKTTHRGRKVWQRKVERIS